MTDQTTTTQAQAQRVWLLRDQFLRNADMAGMSDLYAPDATLESPLVAIFSGDDSGLCQGRAAILAFLAEAAKRRPNDKVHWHREGFLWNGKTLFWEYPSSTPDGRQQLDVAEVMDLFSGKIQRHRIYWGWRAVENVRRGN